MQTDPHTPAPELYRLGAWRVDSSDGSLRRAGETLRLEPRAMALLQALVRRRGEVASRDELLAEVWADAHVHDIALARTVSELRKALGDSSRHPRYIETIPKRGYRLIAEIRSLDAAPVAAPAPRTSRRFWPAVAAMGTIALLAVVLLGRNAPSADSSEPVRVAETQVEALHRRGLEYYGRHRLQDYANAIDLFERALALDPEFVPARIGLAETLAQQARLHQYEPALVDAAVTEARRAAAAAPESAEALKALGLAYSTRGWLQRGAAAYRRALAVDPNHAAARNNLGVLLWQMGERPEALEHVLRRLQAGTDEPIVVSNLAMMLDGLGFEAEAEHWFERALALEPRRTQTVVSLAYRDLFAGNPDRARHRLDELIELVSSCVPCLRARADVERFTGSQAAAEAVENYHAAAPDWLPAMLYRSAVLLDTEPAAGRALLDRTDAAAREYAATGTESWWAHWSLGALAALRGETNAALEALGRAVDAGWLAWRHAEREPIFSSLHETPGFRALLDRMQARIRTQRERVRSAGLLNALPSGTLSAAE